MLQHLRQLGLAAGKRREIAAVVKALGAQHRPLFDRPPHCTSIVKAFETCCRVDQFKVKALTGNAPRGSTHVHRTGRCSLLQPRCMVHGRAHRLAVADHHAAGGNADAQLQAQVVHGGGQGEAGAHGHGGGVFTGHGVAEIAHEAVVTLRVVGQAGMGTRHLRHFLVVVGQALAVFLIAQGVHQPG